MMGVVKLLSFMDQHDHKHSVVGDFSQTVHWSTRAIIPSTRHIRLLSAAAALLLLVPLSFAAVYIVRYSSPKPYNGLTNKQAAKQITNQHGSTTTDSTPSPTKSSSNTTTTTTNQSNSANTGSSTSGTTNNTGNSGPSPYPQTTWAACTNGGVYKPLSDTAAAALVTPAPETRKYNATPFSINGVPYQAANYYVPTSSELSHFESAVNQYGQTAAQADPYLQYVDGHDDMQDPSTDDLIQWAAHKWGIPEDWLRAEYAVESYWNQFNLGDKTTVSAAWYSQYPVQSQVSNSSDVYQSLGITQVRWAPDNSVGIGTEPLRWKSTAFNIDFQAATVRFYYDNPDGARSTWGDGSYIPCQQWNSIGGWFNPYPWNNSGQASYISQVQQYLTDRTWTTQPFLNFTPSVPAIITFQ